MTVDRTLLWPSPNAARRGPKPKLTRAGIVDAAIAIADAEGLAAVSMQRVADDIGATKMALYRHVPGKAELTALMLDARLGVPPAERPAGLAGRDAWRARLTTWTLEVHACFRRAPWMLELAVGARILGPNELTWYERGLEPLADSLLSGEERFDVLALLAGHARGIAQQEATASAPERETDDLMAEIVAEHADRYPHVAAVLTGSGADPGASDRDAALAFGIDRILDGIESLIARRRAAGTASARENGGRD